MGVREISVKGLKRKGLNNFDLYFRTLLSLKINSSKRDEYNKEELRYIFFVLLGKIDLLFAMKLINFDEFHYLSKAVEFAYYDMEVA